MTTAPLFDYELAADLPMALAAVASGAVPIHGGTELLPAMTLGVMAPERIVSLRSVDELRDCRVTDGQLTIGSGMTHREISRNELIARHAPVLTEVAANVGNIRVRSVGTIGGNVAFAEPRSDVLIALLALRAQVHLATVTSRRSEPLEEFLLGPFEVDIQPGEIITAVTLDVCDAQRAAYRKIVRSERPVVGGCLASFGDGRWRLVIGAAALTPTIVDADDPADFNVDAIVDGIDATADLSGSAAYKRQLARVVINRCRDAVSATEGNSRR